MVLPLRSLLFENDGVTLSEHSLAFLSEVFSSFSPSIPNADVTDFIINKAVEFEKDRLTETFLAFDDNGIADGKFILQGFFSLSINLLCFRKDTSAQNMEHIRSVQHSISGTNFPTYLIGQLARSVSSPKGFGKQLFLAAIGYIKVAQNCVGGSIVCIDCKDSLLPYYYSLGFSFLSKSTHKDNNGDTLNRLYIVI